MKRLYPQHPEFVVERRLGQADARRAKVPDTESWSRFATLPPGEMTVPEKFWGRRAVQRYLRANGGDVVALSELIEALDVGGEEG